MSNPMYLETTMKQKPETEILQLGLNAPCMFVSQGLNPTSCSPYLSVMCHVNSEWD